MHDPLLPEELLSHAGWMRSLARGLVLDEARAEDIVQEAFTAVAERRPSRPGSLGAWLRGTVQNLARHSRREETRRRRREEAAARPESCPPSHAELLERAELQRAVVDCVIGLPEPYRATILARYFNDMQAGDIAARDRVPPATVRTRLQRGLERLRRALDERHGGDRETWRALLVPLAVTGFWTGSAAAAPGFGGASTAFTGKASGVGASSISKISIGGVLLAHKTITVAAGAAIL